MDGFSDLPIGSASSENLTRSPLAFDDDPLESNPFAEGAASPKSQSKSPEPQQQHEQQEQQPLQQQFQSMDLGKERSESLQSNAYGKSVSIKKHLTEERDIFPSQGKGFLHHCM